jgi:WD40 repeat protein
MAVDSADVAMCVKLLSRHLPGAVGEDRRGFEWHRLWRLCHDETKVFVDHDDAVYHAAFSRDGKELAVVSADGRLTVWNLATGKARVLSDPHRGEANAVIYTADGRFLVSCSDDTTIKVRSSAGDLLRTLRGHTMAVMTIAVHPAQPLLLSGSRDGHVRLWNVDTGDLVREWKVMDGETVDAVTFNADGTQAYASGGRGKITHLPDIISSDQQRTVAQMGAAHTAILLRADDSELVVAGHGKDVVILDAQTGERLRRWETQSDWVQGMALADNGDSLVTASRNGMVQVWSLEDGARLNRLTGHRSRVWGVAVSPDGALIASCGEDRTVRLWSAHRAGTDPVLWSSRAPLTALADGPLGSSILFGNQRGMVRHLDAATGEEIANWRLKGAVASLTSSMSGRLAACSEDGEIRVWNHTGRREEVVYRWSLAGTVSIVLSPDGRRLAACTKTGRLVLWNVGSDDAVAMVNAHASGAVLAFDSTGETIFSGGYDNFVKAWDGSTLEQKGEFAGHTQFVNTLAESRELGLLASASTDGSSALLRLPGLEPVGEIHGLGPALKAARFFSDARTLITVDVKGTVHTWNLPTSQVAMSMDTCLFEVRDARLTRDGRHWVLLGRTQGSGKWTILSWPIAMGSDRVMSGE